MDWFHGDSFSTHKAYGLGMIQAHYIYCASQWCSVAQLCLILCNPMDCSLQGSSVHGISQASSVPFPSPGDLPNPGIKLASTASPALADWFFTTEPPENPIVHFIFNLMLQLIWQGVPVCGLDVRDPCSMGTLHFPCSSVSSKPLSNSIY